MKEQPRQATPGRNEACWCGSGRKYKKCHMDSDRTAARRTVNRDPWTGNEVRYAEFSGDGSFAAVVLVTAAPGYVLEPRDMTGHFARMLPGAEIIWEEQGSVQAAGGRDLRYRMFRLPETDFGCVAFDGWWRPAPEDGQVLRFTRQTFGFYCRAAERALGEAEVRRIIRRIRFRPERG